MRLAVLADVHANLPALEAVLEDLHHDSLDGMVVAGDLVACPQAEEALHLLLQHSRWVIRGNSDLNLLEYDAGDAPPAWHTHKQFGLLRWVHANISRAALETLRTLPDQMVVETPGSTPIRIVHGSPGDPFGGLDPQQPEALLWALNQVRESVLVCGHTHIPWQFTRDGRLALNPGAVSGALNGDPRAQYAVLTWRAGHWEAEHRAVVYDLARLRRSFEESGLLEVGGALARAFLLSNETGLDVAEYFLTYALRLADEAGRAEGGIVPDAIWDRADATFNWEAYSSEGGR